MENLPLVSIIVPVYNAEKYIEKCVNSLINQTYRNLQIILIDDGSTDSSPVILDNYAKTDNRIQVIHKQNGGVSSARNAGLSVFKGDYVSFVDADDYVELNYIELLLQKAIEFNCDIVRCDNDLDGKFESDFTSDFFIKQDTYGSLLNQDTISSYVHHFLYKKQLLFDKNSKLYLFDENLHIGEDLVFNSLITTNANSYYYLSKCLYHKKKCIK